MATLRNILIVPNKYKYVSNRCLQNQFSWNCQPPACLNVVSQLLEYNLMQQKKVRHTLRTSGISHTSPVTQHITAQLSHRNQHFLPRTFTTHSVTDHRSSAQPLLKTLFSKAPKSLSNFKRPKGVGEGKPPAASQCHYLGSAWCSDPRQGGVLYK